MPAPSPNVGRGDEVNLKPIAILFPGQGAQRPGMCGDLAADFPAARRALEEVDEALGMRVSRAMTAEPSDEAEAALARTQLAQPALLAHSVAAERALRAEIEGSRAADAAPPAASPSRGLQLGPFGVVCAMGHSVGEYAALVAVGALTLADAALVLRLRARAMQRAADLARGATGMTALLFAAQRAASEVAPSDALASLVGELGASCAAASRELPLSGNVAAIAGVNSPHQVVISGHVIALERAVEAYSARAAAVAGTTRHPPVRKAIRLPVGAPFHCSIMEPAARSLRSIGLCNPAHDRVADDRRELREHWDHEFEAAAAAALRLGALRAPVVSNADASLLFHADQVRPRLADSVTRPVLWAQSVLAAHAAGARHFLELGPGSALANLVRQTIPSASVFSVGTTKELRSYLGFLRKLC